MRVCSLASVRSLIVLGEPLPFSVRDAAHMLLLAQGQVIEDEPQLMALLRRGAVVEADAVAQLRNPARRQMTTEERLAQLPAAWDRMNSDVRQALASPADALAGAVSRATTLLLGLIDAAPDVAIAQVVRQREVEEGHYGVTHSIHAATACRAAARFLGWDSAAQRRAFQAALTMNLGMLDLQARLAHQAAPLTFEQREQIRAHPQRSVEMLEAAGVTDADWLDAVLKHHELPDGSGYPSGIREISDMAQLLRFADVYTARLAARASRPAMSAHQAGAELHQMADSSPLASALIKAFGVFPPGTFVRLASGELGMVVRNGDKAYRPIVAALTNSAGEPRLTPLVRDSADATHAVVGLLPAKALPMRLGEERIASLIGTT